MLSTITRQQLGNIGEAKAKLYFIEQGYDIFVPETVNPPFDFIVVKNNICQKVEVKSSMQETGQVKLGTCYTTTKEHIAEKFKAAADLLVLYHYPTNVLKVLNAKEYKGRNSVRIQTIKNS